MSSPPLTKVDLQPHDVLVTADPGAGPSLRPGPASWWERAHPDSRVEELVRFLRWYGDERVNSRLIDERRSIPPSMLGDLGSVGLLGLQIETRLGGLGLSTVDSLRLLAQAAAVDPNLALLFGVHNAIGVPPIRGFARDPFRSEALSSIAAGRALATMAASELGIGSNVRGMVTRAVQQPDGDFVIDGRKSWISLASWARYVNVIAKVTDENGRLRGISAFLVDTSTPGFRPGAEAMTFGMRGVPQNHVILDGVRVGPDRMLGDIGAGFDVAQTSFLTGRLYVAGAGVGVMQRCLQLVGRFAERRTVATGRLMDNGHVGSILTRCLMSTRAAEVMSFQLAHLVDSGRTVPPEMYLVCKIMCSELMWEVVDTSVQLLGARGFLDTNVVGQFFRDYRLFRIFEGATEAMAVYLGAVVRRDPGRFADALVDLFGPSPIIDDLRMVIDSVGQELDGADPGSRKAAHERAYGVIGDLVCWATTAVVAGSAAVETGSDIDERTQRWTTREYRGRAAVLYDALAAEPLSPDLLSAHISGFRGLIGDVEHSLGGEVWELDGLLRRDDL